MKKVRSGPEESGGGCQQTLTFLNQLMMRLELQTNITSNGNGDGRNDDTRRNNYSGPLNSDLNEDEDSYPCEGCARMFVVTGRYNQARYDSTV